MKSSWTAVPRTGTIPETSLFRPGDVITARASGHRGGSTAGLSAVGAGAGVGSGLRVGRGRGVGVRVGVTSRIGSVGEGGDLRLGIFDENGEGEAVGGIIVMRYNQNADKVITAVKEKMKEVAKGLPAGVKFKTSYDRSTLIKEAVRSVRGTLFEEMLAVSLVVLLFLFHWRSALIILIQMPISIAVSFILLNALNISSNIMSLTGIILAIGVIVDDTIVMVENSYRHLADDSSNPEISQGINPDSA